MTWPLEKRRAWYAQNKERLRSEQRAYRSANQELLSAQRAARREKAREEKRSWRTRHPAESKAQSFRWRRANRAVLNAALARRRSRIRKGACSCCAPWSFKFMYAQAKALQMHVDHIKPLAREGLHCLRNLRLLEPLENQRKGAREGAT